MRNTALALLLLASPAGAQEVVRHVATPADLPAELTHQTCPIDDVCPAVKVFIAPAADQQTQLAQLRQYCPVDQYFWVVDTDRTMRCMVGPPLVVDLADKPADLPADLLDGCILEPTGGAQHCPSDTKVFIARFDGRAGRMRQAMADLWRVCPSMAPRQLYLVADDAGQQSLRCRQEGQ